MRLLPALLAVTVAGCSSMNPLEWFGGKDAGPKMAELPALSAALPVTQLWQAAVGPAGNAALSPAVASGGVYAAARDGTVLRLDTSGRQVWRVNASAKLSAGVGADGSLAVVGTDEGEVIALDAGTGSVRWRVRISSEVLAATVVAPDLVLVRSADSRIFALDATDGKRRWFYQRATPTLSVRTGVGIAVSRGLVLAGFPGGRLVALAVGNGALRWEATVASPRGATELERVADVVGIPLVFEREVCAVAYQGRVACFEIDNGKLLWARNLSSTTGVSGDARYLFVSDERGSLHALDRSNGSSVWTQDRLARRGLTAPLTMGRQVAVGDVQGYVHFVARENGDFIGRSATDGSAIRATPLRMESALLVQTRAGGIHALATR